MCTRKMRTILQKAFVCRGSPLVKNNKTDALTIRNVALNVKTFWYCGNPFWASNRFWESTQSSGISFWASRITYWADRYENIEENYHRNEMKTEPSQASWMTSFLDVKIRNEKEELDLLFSRMIFKTNSPFVISENNDLLKFIPAMIDPRFVGSSLTIAQRKKSRIFWWIFVKYWCERSRKFYSENDSFFQVKNQ